MGLVSSEQSRESLARSQRGSDTLTTVSVEFLGLPVVINISGYPGSSPESIRAAALFQGPLGSGSRVGYRMDLSTPTSRWNHTQP